ncbi:DUF4386 family protein [Actinokineospora sp. NBRC 105648]|uniref:DUF4386 family protein n=1 Tax=Actinokineospora sp. NBRC 105648 TaxID=3032206 RepID=UPI0024A0058D|nr:DUF4386 family protein [Actinokineospora sp. NBRC 105648]GLZ36494.1 hypothetical protein Acsp05_01190 [Actinokineospora sp. NBRC 105648]
MREGVPERATAVLLLVEGLLLFVPLVVLGAAVDWPASLGEPAAAVLPRVAEHEAALRVGYVVYLAYSALFLPVALWAMGTLAPDRQDSRVARLGVAFAALSTVARCVGIVRWLTTMPDLAHAWQSGVHREAIEVQYDALNSFAGGVGELLGVSLFAAGWLLCLAKVASIPLWLKGFTVVTAAALALPLVELLGVDAGALISVGSATVQVWFLVTAVHVVRGGRRSSAARDR